MERPVSAAAVLLSVAILICGAATVEGEDGTPATKVTQELRPDIFHGEVLPSSRH